MPSLLCYLNHAKLNMLLLMMISSYPYSGEASEADRVGGRLRVAAPS